MHRLSLLDEFTWKGAPKDWIRAGALIGFCLVAFSITLGVTALAAGKTGLEHLVGLWRRGPE